MMVRLSSAEKQTGLGLYIVANYCYGRNILKTSQTLQYFHCPNVFSILMAVCHFCTGEPVWDKEELRSRQS
jgi:hypothetical protein